MSEEEFVPTISSDEDLKFLLVDDSEFTFTHFANYEENLIKITIKHDCNEHIWVCVSDEVLAKIKNGEYSNNMEYPANLRNTSIYGIPWGSYIPIQLRGSDRPICYLDKIPDGTEFIYNQTETISKKSIH